MDSEEAIASSSGELNSVPTEADTTEDIDKMRLLLQSVKSAFDTQLSLLNKKINIFLIVAIVLSIFIISFYNFILHGFLRPNFECNSNFEISYDIGVRVTVISLFISIIAFCLKMMRVYLSLSEKIYHKLAIVESMPILVHANKDRELFKSSYSKIVEMLVEIDKSAGTGKDDDIKIEGLVDFFKGIIKKD